VAAFDVVAVVLTALIGAGYVASRVLVRSDAATPAPTATPATSPALTPRPSSTP
jgi:hypothetical protein